MQNEQFFSIACSQLQNRKVVVVVEKLSNSLSEEEMVGEGLGSLSASVLQFNSPWRNKAPPGFPLQGIEF